MKLKDAVSITIVGGLLALYSYFSLPVDSAISKYNVGKDKKSMSSARYLAVSDNMLRFETSRGVFAIERRKDYSVLSKEGKPQRSSGDTGTIDYLFDEFNAGNEANPDSLRKAFY